jgi:hypothetical protein
MNSTQEIIPTKDGLTIPGSFCQHEPLVRLPEIFEEIDRSMSNFDHTIDEGFEDALKGGKVFGRHAAWDFNGLVWYQDGKFHEEVWVYRSYRKTYGADTLELLMEGVNRDFGSA